MFTAIKGWNVDEAGNRLEEVSGNVQDFSIVTLWQKYMAKKK
jgi:hypothetical protein